MQQDATTGNTKVKAHRQGDDGEDGKANGLLKDADQRWKANYQAVVEYSGEYEELPRQDYKVPFKGITLRPGVWLDKQKQRYKGMGDRSVLSDYERGKLMAIKEFSKWANDPLRDYDARFEVYYQALANYCNATEKLPPQRHKVSNNGTTLCVGAWVSTQKERFVGNWNGAVHGKYVLERLMTINAFRQWAEDPFRHAHVRWEANYQALFEYCQKHKKLPPKDHVVTINGTTLKVGEWSNNHKHRFSSKSKWTAPSRSEKKKLMAIKEFRDWVRRARNIRI